MYNMSWLSKFSFMLINLWWYERNFCSPDRTIIQSCRDSSPHNTFYSFTIMRRISHKKVMLHKKVLDVFKGIQPDQITMCIFKIAFHVNLSLTIHFYNKNVWRCWIPKFSLLNNIYLVANDLKDFANFYGLTLSI